MKRIFVGSATFVCLFAAAAILWSCDGGGNAAAPASGKPELGTWGVTLEDMDKGTAPGDDFYRHVNGAWLDRFEIPEEFSRYGSFTVLFERSEKQVQAIVDAALDGSPRAGSDEQKIADYYSAYLDTGRIEQLGLAPLAAHLEAIDAADDHRAIARLMASPDFRATNPFAVFVNVDAKRPERYALYLTHSGLGMPNRDYYLSDSFATQAAAYKEYIEQMLDLAGVADAGDKAERIYRLEHAIAGHHWPPAKRRQRELTHNPHSMAELRALAPGVPWDEMMEAGGLAVDEVVVREVDAIENLAALFAKTDVGLWRDYLRFHLLNGNSALLPSAFDKASFAFFGTTLRGTPKQRERWKRGIATLNGNLGDILGRVYVQRHFPPSSKAKMEELVANLKLAMAERLQSLSWMGDATREQALDKLSGFVSKIGYPDRWEDYSKLAIKPGDAYGNAVRAGVWAWHDSIARLGGPIDRSEWFMNPQQVNAYYSPTRNEIVFPAAILQAPFFDPHADPAVNYGAIGAVIGHEIGHGFDDQGRKSDGTGMLRDWWTADDSERFDALAARLGKQYAGYEPIEGHPVNPQLTMGENIGDLGGLSMAYYAYKLSLGGKEDRILDGYTGDQRFFMAWAQVWKSLQRDDALINQIATDPHSPAIYRVNGVVRNMDAWYEAFGVKRGDALWLPPQERVQIW